MGSEEKRVERATIGVREGSGWRDGPGGGGVMACLQLCIECVSSSPWGCPRMEEWWKEEQKKNREKEQWSKKEDK